MPDATRTHKVPLPFYTYRDLFRVPAKPERRSSYSQVYLHRRIIEKINVKASVHSRARNEHDERDYVCLYTAIEERGRNVKRPSQVSCYSGRQSDSQQCLLLVS